MANQIISTIRTTQVSLADSDVVTVLAGLSVSNTAGSGIVSTGSNGSNAVFAYGMVASSATAIALGSATATQNFVYVGADGAVNGAANAIVLTGSRHRIENRGDITANQDAIFLSGAASENNIVNYGSIYGSDTGITNTGTGSIGVLTTNFGTITGFRAAYDATASNNQSIITNRGSIIGDILTGASNDIVNNYGTVDGDINLGVNGDRLTNSGTIIGDVYLGDGADTFRSTGAGGVEGEVYGGNGFDYFYLGAGEDIIYGGADQDFLVFDNQPGLRIALDGSFENTGVAKGDYYREVEGVFGSLKGADFIKGDAQANVFYGNGGADTLYGGANADTLSGGSGKDVLFGGFGDDVFYFYSPSEGGDKINDFSNVVGNNDRFEISIEELASAGIISAGPLASNALYRGTTNICTGAEDRIIVRTTDNTVWFDSNGRAADGLTMLADLQAGVTLTFADFFFV